MSSLFDSHHFEDPPPENRDAEPEIEHHRGLPVMTVNEMTLLLKEVIEPRFRRVAVMGELSNVTRAGSGHVYLTLKDEFAQVRGVIWRSAASRLRFDLHDGLEVVAVGAVEVYQPRGTYQLIIGEMLPRGVGPLELAFRQLHDKLAAEGVFAAELKRPLPRYPRGIALVTSPSGAAVRDLLQVILRRWPKAHVLIVPVPVQGAAAAPAIAAALQQVHRLPNVDVVITGRGGGSLEDLWAFNEEIVARAIRNCRLPVISAVGHEVDVTIADLAADRRALTPSEAAEIVTAAWYEAELQLRQCEQRLVGALAHTARRSRQQLEQLANRRCFRQPLSLVRTRAEQLDELQQRLPRVMARHLQQQRQQLSAMAGRLDALSPLKVLNRGYSVVRRVTDGHVIRSVGDVRPGEQVENRVADGTFLSRVEEIPRDETEPRKEDQNG